MLYIISKDVLAFLKHAFIFTFFLRVIGRSHEGMYLIDIEKCF